MKSPLANKDNPNDFNVDSGLNSDTSIANHSNKINQGGISFHILN